MKLDDIRTVAAPRADEATALRAGWIDTVIGRISVTAPDCAWTELSWPTVGCHAGHATDPVAGIRFSAGPVPNNILDRVRDRVAVVSDHHTRGAFPMRYWPGEPWVMQWTNGPTVLRSGTEVTVYGCPEASSGRWLNRALREVLVKLGRHRGFTVAHGAVIGTVQGMVALCGPSGVGKTDCALRFARHLELDVLGVDRFMIGPGSRGLACGALSFGANVGLRTLASLAVDMAGLPTIRPIVNEKIYLSTREFEKRVATTAAQGVLRAIFVLHRPGEHGWTVAPNRAHAIGLDQDDHAFEVDYLGLGDTLPLSSVPLERAFVEGRPYLPGGLPPWAAELTAALAGRQGACT